MLRYSWLQLGYDASAMCRNRLLDETRVYREILGVDCQRGVRGVSKDVLEFAVLCCQYIYMQTFIAPGAICEA